MNTDSDMLMLMFLIALASFLVYLLVTLPISSVPQYKEDWRCDKWQFFNEGHNIPVFELTDLYLATVNCPYQNYQNCTENVIETDNYIFYDLPTLNRSFVANKIGDQDCVEWVKVRTKVN